MAVRNVVINCSASHYYHFNLQLNLLAFKERSEVKGGMTSLPSHWVLLTACFPISSTFFAHHCSCTPSATNSISSCLLRGVIELSLHVSAVHSNGLWTPQPWLLCSLMFHFAFRYEELCTKPNFGLCSHSSD